MRLEVGRAGFAEKTFPLAEDVPRFGFGAFRRGDAGAAAIEFKAQCDLALELKHGAIGVFEDVVGFGGQAEAGVVIGRGEEDRVKTASKMVVLKKVTFISELSRKIF